MTDAITAGVLTMSIASVTIIMTIVAMTIVVRARTGNTTNATPASWRGLFLLLVALKHQLAFP